MSFFGIFNKKASTVTAHIFDSNSGYSKEKWTVGQDVPRETTEKFSASGNLFVIVVHDAGMTKQIICKRDVWDEFKAKFDRMDSVKEAAFRRAQDALDSIKSTNTSVKENSVNAQQKDSSQGEKQMDLGEQIARAMVKNLNSNVTKSE